MTTARRTPYPAIGATLALWDSPSVWFADVRVLKRVGRGDVLLRIVRSADGYIRPGWNVPAKILRSGRWKIRANTGHRSGSAGVVREQYEGAMTVTTQPLAFDLDVELSRDETELPSYFADDECGRAIIHNRRSGAVVRAARRRTRSTQPSLNR